MSWRAARIIVGAALIASACSSGGDETPNPETSSTLTGARPTTTTTTTTVVPDESLWCAEPIVIGLVTDLTGGARIFGTRHLAGAAIGLAHAAAAEPQKGQEQMYRVDECDIRLLVADDQANPDVAAIVAEELIGEGAVVLIGASGSAETSAVQRVAEDQGVILLALQQTAPGVASGGFGPNTFLLAENEQQEAVAVCEYFIGDGLDSFAQIAGDHISAHRAAAAYRDACTRMGGGFVAADEFASVVSPETVGANLLGADVVLVSWEGPGLGELIDSVNDGAHVVAAPFPSYELISLFFADGVGVESVVTYHHELPANDLNEVLIAHSDVLPDRSEARAMTAALLAVHALSQSNEPTDIDSRRAAFEGLEVESPKGRVELRAEDHLPLQDLYIVRLVDPFAADAAFYEHLATIRPNPPCVLQGDHADRCDGVGT